MKNFKGGISEWRKRTGLGSMRVPKPFKYLPTKPLLLSAKVIIYQANHNHGKFTTAVPLSYTPSFSAVKKDIQYIKFFIFLHCTFSSTSLMYLNNIYLYPSLYVKNGQRNTVFLQPPELALYKCSMKFYFQCPTHQSYVIQETDVCEDQRFTY